jgi:ABC-type sugar transport system permease subunit
MKTLTLRQLRHHWFLLVLMLPTFALIFTFSYYPAYSAFVHAFYQWNGDELSQWVGLENFRTALSDDMLAQAFGTVVILIVANVLKMAPAIITAVVIHRLFSERARYFYRVAFVIPMIIPAMVWLLIWKYFYNPTFGVLNKLLTGTCLMDVLAWLDVHMPRLAGFLQPVNAELVGPLFGGVWGLLLTGALCLTMMRGLRGVVTGWMWSGAVLVGGLLVCGPARWAALVGGLTAALLLAGRAAGDPWSASPRARKALKWAGVALLVLAALLVATTRTWTEPTKAFEDGRPAWLGQEELIVPALIFWGFPWVSVVSVLLYLSGLGNIDQSVYEAAEMDGCGWVRKLTHVELPLIMTQVRLNLILMVIHTLRGWGLVFILLGSEGGPGNAGMLPGLYMFHKAFVNMKAGYACAIGLLLFLLIVYLTVVNNKYVRVEK